MTAIEPASGFATGLEKSFGPHLTALCERTARALAACGYEGLLVHSGSALTVFEDDRTYPFEAHAPFKVWVPLADVPDSFVWFEPGSKPKLILNQPRDYWYKPADLPRGYWVSHFEVCPVPDAAGARAALPKDLSGTAYIGDITPEFTAWGVSAANPRPLMRRLDYHRAGLDARTLAMLDYAVKITKRPAECDLEDVERLRKHGFDDEDIWDIAEIAAMYNYTNRLASATGMLPNPEYHGLAR